MSDIDARVKKIVVEQLGVKEDEVSNSSSFVDDLGADSLDTVELVMALEEEFECEIPDEEAEKITTDGSGLLSCLIRNPGRSLWGFNVVEKTCCCNWPGCCISRW